MKATPETIYAGEFILSPGVDENGRADISIHSQHGKTFVATIGVKDIPQWVNDLEHSYGSLETGLMAFWVDSGDNHTSDDMLLFWRWRFVDCWRHYQTEQAGEPVFVHEIEDRAYVLPMYPRVLRFTVANYMEGAMIEHLGAEEGIKAALNMHVRMVAPAGTGQWLTPMGIEATERLTLVFFEVMEAVDNGTFVEEELH